MSNLSGIPSRPAFICGDFVATNPEALQVFTAGTTYVICGQRLTNSGDDDNGRLTNGSCPQSRWSDCLLPDTIMIGLVHLRYPAPGGVR